MLVLLVLRLLVLPVVARDAFMCVQTCETRRDLREDDKRVVCVYSKGPTKRSANNATSIKRR